MVFHLSVDVHYKAFKGPSRTHMIKVQFLVQGNESTHKSMKVTYYLAIPGMIFAFSIHDYIMMGIDLEVKLWHFPLAIFIFPFDSKMEFNCAFELHFGYFLLFNGAEHFFNRNEFVGYANHYQLIFYACTLIYKGFLVPVAIYFHVKVSSEHIFFVGAFLLHSI